MKDREKEDFDKEKQMNINGEMRRKVFSRLEKLGVTPNENLGQHFLIDDKAIDILAESVSPGNTVIEIGAGVGQLTDELAQRAGKVVAVEIDRRFEPVLNEIATEHPTVQVVFGDAVALRLEDYLPKKGRDKGIGTPSAQIVASLPYHITEPFMQKIVSLPLESITLMVGERLAHAIQAKSEDSPDFGQLTLLAQTFFDASIMAWIGKQSFYPIPRTDSAIIRLIPKEAKDVMSNRRDFLLRRLFMTKKRSPLVKNSLKEGLIDFTRLSQKGTLSKREYNQRERRQANGDLRDMIGSYSRAQSLENVGGEDQTEKVGHQLTQNQAREIIKKMCIPDSILEKPFDQLTNQELETLSKALRS